MSRRLEVVNRIAFTVALQFGLANPESVFGRDRRQLTARARSLSIAIAHAGIRYMTNDQIAEQFNRDRATVVYHAAIWRLPKNATTWNVAVAALRRWWPDAPGPR
jgi:hypothetical protein